MINSIRFQSTIKLKNKLAIYSYWSSSHHVITSCDLMLNKTDIWLDIIEFSKPKNFHFYFFCQNSPMLQCLGFRVEEGSFFNSCELQREILKKYTNLERTKENYISLQAVLMNADLIEASFLDATYIDKIDKIFNLVKS